MQHVAFFLFLRISSSGYATRTCIALQSMHRECDREVSSCFFQFLSVLQSYPMTATKIPMTKTLRRPSSHILSLRIHGRAH
ncbi:hypothetical protein BDZ91DRAFT_282069 [Kalaharituber pfeilii]|nr:hypothetical protein BDZ91DRAFT_282069 [Kalaharituber pfeilii]